jgi:polysaccharide transporter, PST family
MSIRTEVRSGVFYTFIFKYIGIAAQIITTSILARLLTPDEFGIVVAVVVFVTFFQLISDSGIAAAIIQRKDLTIEEIFSLFIVSLILSTILAILFSLAGPLIAKFYNNQEYVKICILLSISLFFYTAHIVPWATMYRDQRFKAIGYVHLTVQILGAVLAIILAMNGFSYYSLVYQSIFLAASKFLIVIILAPITFVKRIRFEVVKKIFKYSMFKFLNDIVQFLSKNLDNLLIGKYLGLNQLGYYDKAYKLMLLPVGSLAEVVSQVLHPVLSLRQNDPDVIYNFLKKLTRYMAIFGIPLSIVLYFSSSEIIQILFGDQWFASIPPFKYLALSVCIQMILSGSQSVFLSLGKSNHLFLSGLLSFLSLAIAILSGIFIVQSITGTALLILIAFIINFFQVYYLLIVRVMKKSIIDFVLQLRTGLLIGAIVFLVNLLLKNFLKIDNIYFSFGIKVICSSVPFILMLILLNELKGFIEIIKSPKK